MKIKLFSQILSSVSNIFNTIRGTIDDVHTSDEERLDLRRKIALIEQEIYSSITDLQSQLYKSQADIITAEASGESWLQRSWRPITMLAFLVMLITWWFGIVNPAVSDAILLEVFGLLKIGIGGYIASRGIEKVADKAVPVFREKLIDDSSGATKENRYDTSARSSDERDEILGDITLRELPRLPMDRLD